MSLAAVSVRASQRPVVPGPGDRERDARRLDVDEHPSAVKTRPRPFVSGVVAWPAIGDDAATTLVDRLIRALDIGRGQIDAVLGENERLAVLRESAQSLDVIAAVFTQDDATAIADGDVVGVVALQMGGAAARRIEDDGENLLARIVFEHLSLAGDTTTGAHEVDLAAVEVGALGPGERCAARSRVVGTTQQRFGIG